MVARRTDATRPFTDLYLRPLIISASGNDLLRPALHAGQQCVREKVLRVGARFVVIIAHRRWGKNWLCVKDMLEQKADLITQDRSQLNPPVVIWFVVPTYVLADELWMDLKRMIPQSEVARIVNSKPQEMDLVDGTHIAIRSAEHPDALVSAGVDLLYMIEAARMRESAWLTVRPTLVSHGRLGRVVFNSTPKGNDWLARLYDRASAGDDPSWAGVRIPAFAEDGVRHELSVMPSDEKLAEERASYPERWFRQEYMAEFLTGEGAVFRNVLERVRPAPSPPKQPLVCGVDLAKHTDFSVFAVFDAGGQMVAIERMNQVSYPAQAERLISFLRDHGVRECVIESNGPGEPFYDNVLRDLHERRTEFQGIGQPKLIAFQTTAQSKRQMIDALAVAFERGDITILDDPELVNEFVAYEMTQTGAGNIRFAAPEGGWDDRVMACALAWSEIRAKQAPTAGKYPGPQNLKTRPSTFRSMVSRGESRLRDM